MNLFLSQLSAGPLVLRPWQLTDLDALVRYANNENISDNLTDGFPSPYTFPDAERFFARVRTDHPVKIFAIDLNGEAIGSIGLHPQTDIDRLNAELGYFLGEPFWGQGIVTQAVKAIVAYGFENLPVTRIFARPFPHNPASIKVLTKAGFRLESVIEKSLIKKNVVFDQLIYSIRKPGTV